MLTSINAHAGPRPKPQCHRVRILREQGKPAISLPLPQAQPISTPRKKKRTEAQNERPPPARGWLKANCGVPSFDLHFYKSNPGPGRHGTWHCYTRCSSCGLTTGSISDRRKVNFPKTLYTHLPPSLTCLDQKRHRHRSGPSLSQSRTPTNALHHRAEYTLERNSIPSGLVNYLQPPNKTRPSV